MANERASSGGKAGARHKCLNAGSIPAARTMRLQRVAPPRVVSPQVVG